MGSGGVSGTIGGMPNKPKTPHMAFRIPSELQGAARAVNQARRLEGFEETLSDVVREALQVYVAEHGKKDEQ
jgi:hypothetical protein